MPDFGIFRGFNDKLFGNKLYAGQLPTQLGNITYIGLLDLFPNSSVAFSLRKLSANYNGSAIRVRRSSDNTEQDIGFVNNELDTTALTTFCGSGNGFVTTWYDQSGNGRNATQVFAAAQPQIVSNGIIINLFDKPSLFFDGNNDFLEISYKPTTNIIAVESLQKFNSASGISLSISEPSPQLYLQWVNSTNTFNNYYNGVGTTTAYSNNRLLHSFYMNNSGGGFYQNSTLTVSRLQGSSTASANNINIGRWNGGSLNANCNHQEFILWQSDQSPTRIGIESNINSYYGIY